jgi:RES domain-containing protein
MRAELPDVQALFDRISALADRTVGLDETVFRSATIQFAARVQMLSGLGASKFGGRWNRKGISTVYSSLDIHTAVDEAYQQFERAGFSRATILPRVFVGAEVHLQCLLDLTDSKIRRALGFRLGELICEDWQAIQFQGDESWTQTTGRGCFQAEFEGLIVPSARRRNGRNLVVFPEQFRRGSHVRLLNANDLPVHPGRK